MVEILPQLLLIWSLGHLVQGTVLLWFPHLIAGGSKLLPSNLIIYVMDWVVIESGVLIGPLLSSITSNSKHTQV